jgi:sigma-E factor negative regulatory protein RseB
MYKNEPVSYIMLNDGIVSVSIYISAKKITLDEQQKIIQRGATVLYTSQKGDVEVNIVGDIPVVTAKRLIESVAKVD